MDGGNYPRDDAVESECVSVGVSDARQLNVPFSSSSSFSSMITTRPDPYCDELRRVQRERQRLRRANETSDERDARLEAARALRVERSNDSSDEIHTRRFNNSIQRAIYRRNESQEAIEARRVCDSNRVVRRNASRSANLHSAAFHYSSQIDYSSHPLIVIGKMDNVCRIVLLSDSKKKLMEFVVLAVKCDVICFQNLPSHIYNFFSVFLLNQNIS